MHLVLFRNLSEDRMHGSRASKARFKSQGKRVWDLGTGFICGATEGYPIYIPYAGKKLYYTSTLGTFLPQQT